jgi:hypothetical protein
MRIPRCLFSIFHIDEEALEYCGLITNDSVRLPPYYATNDRMLKPSTFRAYSRR